ncbi:hypothetical protein ACFQ1S_16330, partial [Kibdelosporangium lantanae]
PRPDVIVALTDGQTPWPSARPPCRTVVALFPRQQPSYEDSLNYRPNLPPDWALTVTVAG